MSNPSDILRLYYTVLYNDIRSHSVKDDDIKAAIDNMSQVYKPHPQSLSSTTRRLADYNTVAHRCAYLHKYAPFHTAMVSDILKRILYQNQDMYWTFKQFSASKFRICSLGGGPGSDIVGVVAALSEMFGVFNCSAKVVDVKSHWKDTLRSVINEMRSGDYGVVGHCFGLVNFEWEYLTADLLDEVDGDVIAAIGNADLVTMVKFVSAAACQSTEIMLKKIFTMVKPGSLVLFIDNAGGGFRQLVSQAAGNCNLKYVHGPICHEHYTKLAFHVDCWDRPSCSSTTVTIHMMQKLHPVQPSINIRNDNRNKNSFPNKRIKSAVYEPSKKLPDPCPQFPQASARQEPDIDCQASREVLNHVQAECSVEETGTGVSESKNTVKSQVFASLNSKLPSFNERPNVKLNKKTECNDKVLVWNKNNHENEQISTLDCNRVDDNDPGYKSSANNNSTSKAQDGLSNRHIHNNINPSIVLNSTLKAYNRQPIATNNTAIETDTLIIKNGVSSLKSKNSSSAVVDSASTFNYGNSKTSKHKNSGIVVNSQPKANNGIPRMKNYGDTGNSPKLKDEKDYSISNALSTATGMPNSRSLDHINTEIKGNVGATYPTSCNDLDISQSMDKRKLLKKNGPISVDSKMSLRQDIPNTSISEETSDNYCCSSCVIS